MSLNFKLKYLSYSLFKVSFILFKRMGREMLYDTGTFITDL